MINKSTMIASVIASLFILQSANATQSHNEQLLQQQIQFLSSASQTLLNSDEVTAQNLLSQYKKEAEQLGVSQYFVLPKVTEPSACKEATQGYDEVFKNSINSISEKNIPATLKVSIATGVLYGALVAALGAITSPIYKESACTEKVVTGLTTGRGVLEIALSAYNKIN